MHDACCVKLEKGMLLSVQESLQHCVALNVYCSVSAGGVGQGLSSSVGADDVETLSPLMLCGRQLPTLLLLLLLLLYSFSPLCVFICIFTWG